MESKKELYKYRAKKQGDRAVRARLKDEASKAKRENLLLSKRRIPLSEIQGEEKGKYLAICKVTKTDRPSFLQESGI